MVGLDTALPKPKLLGGGLASVCILWLWGALLLFAPAYLGTGDLISTVLSAAGWGLIGLSFAGAGFQLARLLGIEAVGYCAVAILVLIPAAVIHFAVGRYAPSLWVSVGRLITLGAVGFGGVFLVYGLASFLRWLSQMNVTEAHGWELVPESREEMMRFIIIVAVLALNVVTALLGLIIR